jgi:hypothetical protein
LDNHWAYTVVFAEGFDTEKAIVGAIMPEMIPIASDNG